MFARAYHHLILPDGTAHSLVVVRFDDHGHYVDFHHLLGEEPFVEWEGGTLDLRKNEIAPTIEPQNDDLCQEQNPF